MRPMLLFACFLILVAGCCDKREPPSRGPQEAAKKGHILFASLINEQTYRGFGFDSFDEVWQAELGRPMAVFYLRREQLAGKDVDQLRIAGKDADQLRITGKNGSWLLVRSPESIYPLIVNGQVRSSVTVVETGKRAYRAAGFGDAALVKRLSRYRSYDAADEFVIHVLGLNMSFLGRKAQEGFTLTPIEDDRRLELRAGERYTIDAVLQLLGEIAREPMSGEDEP